MRLFLSTLVAAAILPATVNAEVTLESFQALRAEALSFQGSAEATPEGQTKTRLEQSVSSALTGIYPQDYAAHVLSNAFRGRAACLAGDQDACVAVADLYRDGEDTWKDLELAADIYWLGCQEGHGPSCERFDDVRDMSVVGRDLPYPNTAYHVEACDAGVAASCQTIHRDMYTFFEDFSQADQDAYGARACALDATLPMCLYRRTDAEKAAAREARLAEVTAACASGEAEGCYFEGAMTQREDADRAYELFVQSCQGGHASGCQRASDVAMEKGNTVAAVDFLRQQCIINTSSCGNLAAHYAADHSPAPSEGEIERLYGMACEASVANGNLTASSCREWEALSFDVFAASALDVIYEEMRPAFGAAQAACMAGDGQSCHELALMASGHQWASGSERHRGLGVGAQQAYALGCEHGHLASCVNTTNAKYVPGDGHPLDTACEAGIESACVTIISGDHYGTEEVRLAALGERCDAGRAAHCSALSQYIARGGSFTTWRRDVPLSEARQAFALARQACELGDGTGCAQQGWYTDPTIRAEELQELKGTKDEAQALYVRACELGERWGCGLAMSALPPHQAMDLAIATCKLGSCEDVYETRLHVAHADAVTTKGLIPAIVEADYDLFIDDWHGTVRRHQRACAAGEAHGCGALGNIYAVSGDLRVLSANTQFIDTGFALFSHACDIGGKGYCQVASDYMSKETPEEKAVHLAFVERQCREGQAWACSSLAYEYEDEDPRRAEALISACKLGDAYRCSDLYWAAFAVPDQAERILATGCAWGQGYDCVELANSHLTDRVPLAKVVLEIGCESGENDACRALQRLN